MANSYLLDSQNNCTSPLKTVQLPKPPVTAEPFKDTALLGVSVTNIHSVEGLQQIGLVYYEEQEGSQTAFEKKVREIEASEASPVTQI